MGVNDVDFPLSYETHHPPNLPRKVEVIKACQRVFVDISQTELIRIHAQRTTILQTGEIDSTLAAGMKLAQQL